MLKAIECSCILALLFFPLDTCHMRHVTAWRTDHVRVPAAMDISDISKASFELTKIKRTHTLSQPQWVSVAQPFWGNSFIMYSNS